MSNEERNGDYAAYPSTGDCTKGLTKRELFAAMAMQGLLSGAYGSISGLSQQNGMSAVRVAAQCAVEHADALLAALDVSK